MQPILRAARVKTHTVSAFKGVWRAGRAPEGYFADAVNLTSAQYPALSTRAQRRVINDCAGVTAMYSHDRMLWLDGTALYYGDDEVGTLTAGEKQFASMGANVVIYPDKKLLNTRTLSLTSLDNLVTVTGASASASHADGSAASATSYAKLAAAGIGAGFRAGDAVRISGFASEELNGTFILQTVSDDFVVILALAGEGETAAGEVTLSREAPDLDFICAYGNRVWGVSNAAHAVYACKLGDPTNWNAFEGISTDSYAAVVPSPGAFTGMSAYLGSVMLFKEEEIVKLFGTKPANFQLVSSQMPGVEKGGARSLAFSDSTLFYKGVNGIYAYDGATPVCISRALGDARFQNARAGALDGRYYVSMRELPANTHALWVYDTQTGTWQKEAAEPVRFFAGTGSDLYFACENGFIHSIRGSGLWYDPAKVIATRLCLQETGFAWSAETGPVSLDMPERQHLTRLNLAQPVHVASFRALHAQGGVFILALAGFQHLGDVLRHRHGHAALNQIAFAVHGHKHVPGVIAVVLEKTNVHKLRHFSFLLLSSRRRSARRTTRSRCAPCTAPPAAWRTSSPSSPRTSAGSAGRRRSPAASRCAQARRFPAPSPRRRARPARWWRTPKCRSRRRRRGKSRRSPRARRTARRRGTAFCRWSPRP